MIFQGTQPYWYEMFAEYEDFLFQSSLLYPDVSCIIETVHLDWCLMAFYQAANTAVISFYWTITLFSSDPF